VLIPSRSQLRKDTSTRRASASSSLNLNLKPSTIPNTQEPFDFTSLHHSQQKSPKHMENSFSSPWIPLYSKLLDMISLYPRHLFVHKPIKLSILERKIQFLLSDKPISEETDENLTFTNNRTNENAFQFGFNTNNNTIYEENNEEMDINMEENKENKETSPTRDEMARKNQDIEWVDRSPRRMETSEVMTAKIGKRKRRLEKKKSNTDPLEPLLIPHTAKEKKDKIAPLVLSRKQRSYSYSPTSTSYPSFEAQKFWEKEKSKNKNKNLPKSITLSMPLRKRKLTRESMTRGNSKNKKEITKLSLRILLAEDVFINAKLALNMLKSGGYTADHAIDGLDALIKVSKAYEIDEPYDLIFMDCLMPGMQGTTATREIRRRFANKNKPNKDDIQLPIIIACTGDVMQENVDECKAAGMNDFLCKPYKKHQILSMLYKWGLIINQLRESDTANPDSRLDSRGRAESDNITASSEQLSSSLP